VQQQDTSVAEDEPHAELQDQAVQRKQFWAYLYGTCANEADAATTTECTTKVVDAKTWACVGTEAHEGPDLNGAVYQKANEGRGFVACVFCAMLHCSEHLARLHLVGPKCTMQKPAAVADLLSVDWYSKQWRLIPTAELEASAVDFPYQGGDGSWTTRKVLMHKRRVTEEHLTGAAPCEGAYFQRHHVGPSASTGAGPSGLD
jgi:hypothetical protein